MGGAIGNIGNSVKAVTKGLGGISPVMEAAMGKIAESGDQRAAFNAVLLATVASVDKKPNFNLELEINDLWVRLGNLRSMSSAGRIGGIGGAMKQMTSSMGGILETAVQALAKGVSR